jgi:hypothetical protein
MLGKPRRRPKKGHVSVVSRAEESQGLDRRGTSDEQSGRRIRIEEALSAVRDHQNTVENFVS